MGQSKSSCPDCGAVPCNHFIEWQTALFCLLCARFVRVGNWGERRILQPIRRGLEALGISARLLNICSKFGLIEIVTATDEKTESRARVLWEEAKRRGIDMQELRPFGRSVEWFSARFGNKTIRFENIPRPEGPMSPSLTWMDDKALMHKHLEAANIPVARGGNCFTLRGAHALFRKIAASAIVKPGVGSRSRHTFMHITDEASLDRAARSAFQLCPWIMVEEELHGMVHRVTLIGGRCFAVLRREPPFVIGDGVKTIREIFEGENKQPARQGPIFHEIPFGDANASLKRTGRTWDDIPVKGETVILGDKVGRGNGGSNTDVTDDVHPENLKLFNRLAEILHDPIVGVDFIIEDMERPWQEQKPCGVIECNSAPFIDLHHYPLRGPVRNAAGALWDVIFPESSLRSRTSQSPKKE